MRPANGSETVLKTWATAGSFSLQKIIAGFPSLPTASVLRSSGDGRRATHASRIRMAPTVWEEEAQRTGKILRSTISRFNPGTMSWASRVPWAKNFSMRSSSPSATASTRASCSALARSASSAGIGPSLRFPSSLTCASIRTRSTVPWKAFSSPMGM